MKAGVLVGAIFAAAIVIGCASAAGITLTSGPTLPDCGGQAVAPTAITLACGDANYGLTHLKWQDWGAASVDGTGSARANNCTPNCAAGKFHDYAVRATASELRTCRSGRKQYTLLVLDYPSSRPKGIGATDTWKFPCDAPGPGGELTATMRSGLSVLLTGTGWQRGGGCDATVTLGFRGAATTFAHPRVGKDYGFQVAVSSLRKGAVVVARQQCKSATLGARLYESAIVVKV